MVDTNLIRLFKHTLKNNHRFSYHYFIVTIDLRLHKSNSRIQKDDHETLLSQTLINELVQKIAGHEYLKDVSDTRLKWLLSHAQNHHLSISFQTKVAT